MTGRRILGAAVAWVILVTSGCGGSGRTTFEESRDLVIWSTDDERPELPVGSAALTDPTITVDRLRNAVVLSDDGNRVVVVGDVVDIGGAPGEEIDPDPARHAYLLDADHRHLLLLGSITDSAGLYSGVPGRRLGTVLDADAAGLRVYGSLGTREVPTYRDPVSGLGLAFAEARDGEVLYGAHAVDGNGRVTAVIEMAPSPSN